MNTVRKFWWAEILALLLTLGIAGCQEKEPPPEPVTITFGMFQYNEAYFESLIGKFKEIHPEITVEVQELPFTQGYDISNFPDLDIVGVDLSFFLQNQVSETLLDLSPLMEQDKSFDISDFYPGTIDLFSSDDKVWALPSGIDPFVLYYNKDLFDANGLDYPTNDWTWNDLLNAAMFIQNNDSDTFGYGILEQHFDINALILISQHNGQLFDDLNIPTRVVYDHPLNIEAMEWYGNLYHLHQVAPTMEQAGDAFGYGDQAILRGILQGKIGMWPGYFSERGGNSWPVDWENLNWGLVAMPGDANASTSGFGTGYAITKNSQHTEAAWEWLVYLSEQVPSVSIPARQSLTESKNFEDSVGSEIANAAISAAENVTLISPSLVRFGEDLQYFHLAVVDIISGESTAGEALNWAQDQIE